MRKPNPFSVLSSVRKFFSDNFQRADTEDGLGFTAAGSRWDIKRGIWRILGGAAYSPPESENFPIATVNMPYQDVEISFTGFQNGAGASLWVTDGGNWWGLGLEQEEVDCNCSTATDCNRWNQAGLCDRWNVGVCDRWNTRDCNRWQCSSWNANTCSGGFNTNECTRWFESVECIGWSGACTVFSGSLGRCVQWSGVCTSRRTTRPCDRWSGSNCRRWSGQNCSGNTCNRWNAGNCNRWTTRNCNQWTVESCNQWFEFTFNCQKCYPQWIRVFQSVNSTVTTMARFLITKSFSSEPSPQGGLTLFFQTVFTNKIIEAAKVFTKNREIKVDLYHDVLFEDKVDVEQEIIYNATGAAVNPSYGILVIPSQNDPNRFIGPIDITEN